MSKKYLLLKRALRSVLFVLLLNVVGMGKGYALSGYGDTLIGDLYYLLIRSGTDPSNYVYHAEVTGHKDLTNAIGNVVIPSSVTFTSNTIGTHTYEVTTISYDAFKNCSGITGVTIPNTVTHIYGGVFANCTGLTGELIIPNSVTLLSGFNGCTGLTSVVIPNSVLQIGYNAFGGCTSLTSVVIPNSVTIIGESAFENCSGLTGNLILPDSLTLIGDFAFSGCSGLTGELTIPNTVTDIGRYAFRNCSNLSAVHYNVTRFILTWSYPLYFGHDSYTFNSTGYPPFEGCSGTLTIGDNVEVIPDYLFRNSGFTGGLIIPNSVTSIGKGAFRDCSGFNGTLTLPDNASFTKIEGSTFSGCSGFTGNLIIPNTVTTIGGSAFRNCSGFNGTLTLPNNESFTKIENSTFYGCSGFTGNLTIPNSVAEIGSSAFSGCSGFNGTLNLPNNESFTKIENNTFYGCSGFTGNLIIPNSVTTIGQCAFQNCSGGSLTIPNSVTTIGVYAFYNSSGFNGTLTLPNNAMFTKIENSTFNGCSGFTGNLTIPNNVTEIGQSAFYGCSGFTGNLTIPNSVTIIGVSAFKNCSGFTGNLNIPNTVTTIGSYAFQDCGGFSIVNYNVTSHADISGGYYSPFQGCGGNLVIGNNVQRIPNYMFYYGGFTGNLTIPNSVTSIGINSFRHCDGFTGELVIPNSVDTISTGAFLDCSGFSGALTVGTGISLLDESAFRRCTGITEIHYNAPNCQTAGSAQYPVFNETANLVKIVIGEDVETLPDYLFANCNSVVFIRSHAETPPTVGGAGTFYGIDRGISVGVPCDSKEDYEAAEYWSEFTNYTGSEYQLAVKANPEHLGRAVIVQQPDCNTTICVVRALPNRGCRFLNWTCNGEVVTQIHSYSFHIDEDKVMVANFEPMRRFTGGGGTFVWSDPTNWEPEGVPTDTMGVDIQSDVIIDTDVNVGSIYNYGNGVVTVMPGAVLTVNQTLDSPDPFGLVVEDGGQVVHHSEGVMATVKKKVDAYDATNEGWSLISFPLADTGYVASVANMLSNEYDLYYYDEPTQYWMNQKYASNGFDEFEAGKGYLYANSGVQNCVFDQAIYVTDRGLMDGHDASVLQGSQSTTGRNATHNTALLADDFSINDTTTISGIEVYAYQTNSDTISTFTGLYVQVYDGNPMNGGQPIWGDENTNIMTSTNWTECYRENMTRPIMRIVADNLNIELEAGTYYLVWSLSCGSTSWGIPVAISHMEHTGNGLQYWQGSWGYASDSGTEKGIGFAFRLFGTSNQIMTNNASLSFIGELESGSATINVPLSYTETAGDLKGFNLVSNPFVHDVTSYSGTNVVDGCFRMNEAKDNLIVSEISETQPLKPAEGFFVKATAEGSSISFNARSRSETARNGYINLEISENGKVIDRLVVKKDSEQLEKLSLSEARTKLFALSDNQEMAIVSCLGNEQPVSFKTEKNGTFTLNAKVDGLNLNYLYLIDNKTGAEVDLLTILDYTFTAKTTDYASRFRLVFSAEDGPSTGSGTFAFISNGDIIITNSEAGAILQILDVTGRVIRCSDAINRVSTSGMMSGVYVLRLIDGDIVRTQKIVIE